MLHPENRINNLKQNAKPKKIISNTKIRLDQGIPYRRPKKICLNPNSQSRKNLFICERYYVELFF